MNSELQPISDQLFLEQFQNQTLDKIHFNHLGHLRLAWLYLSQYEINEALPLICSGIKIYAESLGAKDKFHLTMTHSIVCIIDNRMSSMKTKSWQQFIEENDDLMSDVLSVLGQYFSKEKLFNDKSKTSLISPDIKPIEKRI